MGCSQRKIYFLLKNYVAFTWVLETANHVNLQCARCSGFFSQIDAHETIGAQTTKNPRHQQTTKEESTSTGVLALRDRTHVASKNQRLLRLPRCRSRHTDRRTKPRMCTTRNREEHHESGE
jgi:hypothetical protein